EKGCENDFASNLVKSVQDEMSVLHANGGVAKDGLETEQEVVKESTHSPKSPENPYLHKSEDFELLKGELNSLQGNQTRLVEGIEERFKSLATILKSQNNQFAELTEIAKGLKEENTNLKKSLATYNEK